MSIKVENLVHIYNKGLAYETRALDGVSFESEDGEFLGIIGHTGSGKSTLIQHINGIIKPDEGKVFINDVDISDKSVKLSNLRKKVGLVFQYPEYQLFEETVAKDVAFGPIKLGLSEEEVDARVREALELVGIDYDEYASRSPFDLSGGQKRRVAIAGVIAMKPEVIILDEPTAGLDPKAHREILVMLTRLHEKEKCNIILVSHNMRDMAEITDRIMVMDKGRVVLLGTPAEVYAERDKLMEIGLDTPPVMQFMKLLEDRGIKTDRLVMTMDEAEKEIAELLNNK